VAELHRCLENDECLLTKSDGQQVPIIKSVLPIKLGNRSYLLESFTDIFDLKKMEKQLRYLSLHDALTNRYNRAYFEEEMHRMEQNRCFWPVLWL
jgi:PleD family two-component response regulator